MSKHLFSGQAYDQIRRRPGEVIGDCIVREQRAFREMTEALRRVSGTPEMRNLEYDVTIIEPLLGTTQSALRLNTRWSKTKTRL